MKHVNSSTWPAIDKMIEDMSSSFAAGAVWLMASHRLVTKSGCPGRSWGRRLDWTDGRYDDDDELVQEGEVTS